MRRGSECARRLTLGCHSAPRRWRLRIESTGKPAFDGWRVLLAIEATRQHGIARVIEAGGGVYV